MLTLKGCRLSKKAIISLSIVLGIVAVVLILFWTLFALSTVTVDYKTTTLNLNLTDEEIIEAGNFHYGASVIFDGKNKYIKNINEKAYENENFAYLEVINIETVFPNRYVIHIAEREEIFAVENNGQFLICDEDFRVLRIADSFSSTKDNPILVNNLEINATEVRVGDFLDIGQVGMQNFYDALLMNNRDLTEQKGFIESVTLGTNYVEITDKTYDNITIRTFSDREFVINNIDFALEYKFQLMFAVDTALYSQINSDGQLVDGEGNIVYDYVYDEDGNILYDDNGEPQKGEMWTYERLLNSYILIDNYILNDYQEVAVTDLYYRLVDKK